MTHDELLKKITGVSKGNSKWITNFDDLLTPNAKALRAVVELHKPSRIDKDMTYCEGCSNSAFFPWNSCPTIKAIEKELK